MLQFDGEFMRNWMLRSSQRITRASGDRLILSRFTKPACDFDKVVHTIGIRGPPSGYQDHV